MPFTHLSAPLSARENNSTVMLACGPWPGKDNFQERNEQSFPRAGDRAEIQTNTNTHVTKGRAAQGCPFTSQRSWREACKQSRHPHKFSQAPISEHRE